MAVDHWALDCFDALLKKLHSMVVGRPNLELFLAFGLSSRRGIVYVGSREQFRIHRQYL